MRRALHSGGLLLSGLQAAILEPVLRWNGAALESGSSSQLHSVDIRGILGEYIGSIYTHAQKRPLVVERQRVNFEYEPGYRVPSGETVMAK